MISTVLDTIAATFNTHIDRYEKVAGGDINHSYKLYHSSGSYFLKLNAADRFPGMFAAEASGLNELCNVFMQGVPSVIAQQTAGNQQWLLLQWVEKGMANDKSMHDFGAALAAMHQIRQPFFGWHFDNYIGSLPQRNQQQNSWTDFLVNYRLSPLVQQLFNAAVLSTTDLANAEKLYLQLDQLFPEEPPALLHGDLWSGNYIIDQNGRANIFDPAVYYGHREMDLAMTKLFGGFPESFYEGYNAVYPLEKNWQQRLMLSHLYPLLVHAVLFGGHYITNVKSILQTCG